MVTLHPDVRDAAGDSPAAGPNPAFRLRASQVRLTSRFVNALARYNRFAGLIAWVGKSSSLSWLVSLLVGPGRAFRTMREADDAVQSYAFRGHENADNAAIHMSLADGARPSDYPVFYHLKDIAPSLKSVLDWGGNCGNVFYSFQAHLDFAKDMEWMVYDLPGMIEIGREMAERRNEPRLKFVDVPPFDHSPDLFLACGALHYFPEDLSEILGRFPERPKYVIVNRTPMTHGEPFATTQDAGSFRVACLVRNVEAMSKSVEAMGYDRVDCWETPERRLEVPFYPRESGENYSGVYFVRRD